MIDVSIASNTEFIEKIYNCRNETLARAFGCVLGAFIGDAAGAVLRFMEVTKIYPGMIDKAMALEGGGLFGMGKAQVTDDSEMAMSLMYGLHHYKGQRDWLYNISEE